MVRVTGSGGAPSFTIAGPGGASAATGNENSLSAQGTIGTFRSGSGSVTWVAIAHPRAGAWTITPQPGSAPITGVAIANYMPGASVHASVSGRGYRRVLRWSLRPRS